MAGVTEPGFYYVLDVPADGLAWLTMNQRLFWRVRNERTQGWRTATAWRARKAGLPRIQKARIECVLRFTDKRLRDAGNWAPTAKACVDGLVDAGVFADDNSRHVIGPDMRLGSVVAPEARGLHLFIYPRMR